MKHAKYILLVLLEYSLHSVTPILKIITNTVYRCENDDYVFCRVIFLCHLFFAVGDWQWAQRK